MHVWPDLIYTECASVCAGLAVITDLQSRRIPNWLTGSGVLVGVLLHLSNGGLRDCALSLAAAAISGGIFFLLFEAGGMGAGDVKLMAAVGCLGGIHALSSILIMTVMTGAICAVTAAFAGKRLLETLRNVGDLVAHHKAYGLASHPKLNVQNEAMLRLPYALPIATGCVTTLILGLCGKVSL